jgi:hypothetical protein
MDEAAYHYLRQRLNDISANAEDEHTIILSDTVAEMLETIWMLSVWMSVGNDESTAVKNVPPGWRPQEQGE